MEVRVKKHCPFSNSEYEDCNLSVFLSKGKNRLSCELGFPRCRIPKDCPLKKGRVIVVLKN